MISTPQKIFFSSPLPLNTAEFKVRGIGLREKMKKGIVDRPFGTKDYLFMYFYKPVALRVDDKIIHTSSPCLMIWDSERSHYYGREDRDWLHSWFHCDGKLVRRELSVLGIPLNRPIEHVEENFFESFLVELHHELRAYDKPDPDVVYALMKLFFRRLERMVNPANADRFLPKGLLRARNYMEDKFSEPLRLDDLAKLSGYSVPHFGSLFHHYYGNSPMHYVLQLRLQSAELYLKDHNKKMEDIARECGFYDVYSFSKLFKKHRGMPPSSWRKA